jgi:hypothetical protein
MKRLLGVCTLILCVSFPAFAGHTVAGDNYCSCGTPYCLEDYPGECDDRSRSTPMNAPDGAPESGTAELGIVLVALLLWLRLKA